MTDLTTFHENHGAVFAEVAGRSLVKQYRQPDRTHKAVRKGVGVIQQPYGVLVIEGNDRVEYVNNIVTNRIPKTDGTGVYTFLLTPHGRVLSDIYVYNATDRLLLFTPPGKATTIADDWEVFIEDVSIRIASTDYTVFGVHGPNATEKVASVLTGTSAPDGRLTFSRGTMDEAGVTVVRSDDLAGEESYEVICTGNDAVDVIDILVNHGLNAVLFGQRTWNDLTVEAGTPLFATELEDQIPNVLGIQNAMALDKGCFVGQEVVSKVANQGQPSRRLVGLELPVLPAPEDTVVRAGSSVGSITRACLSPMLDTNIAFAFVDYDLPLDAELTVETSATTVAADRVSLPFVEGSERSQRVPHYE